METTTLPVVAGATLEFGRAKVRQQVRRVRRDTQDSADRDGTGERRTRGRIPVRRAVHVVPVVMEGGVLRAAQTSHAFEMARTIDVSTGGVGFVHDGELPTRHAILTFDLMDQGVVSLLVQIMWSRCGAERQYFSGGKFLAVCGTSGFLDATKVE
jgi:hypothetical protein